jgi:hypothetical protein
MIPPASHLDEASSQHDADRRGPFRYRDVRICDKRAGFVAEAHEGMRHFRIADQNKAAARRIKIGL